MRNERQGPERSLEDAAPARRGRLKLYVGYATGVGKTWRLLEEARALRQAGVDVIGGFVDARPEAAALLGELELAPRRRVEFGGVALEELDVEAILARRPAVAIVDDLARTNAPGARNKRRYQDVLELLSAGLDVIGALDVEQLDAVGDLVQRTTGAHPRETVPDSFLDRADRIVCVDLEVADLWERVQAGEAKPPARTPFTLPPDAREAHLETLRELMLREVAQLLERRAVRRRSPAPPGAAPGRLMVCLPSTPAHAATLLARAARLAGRLASEWYAVHVERAGDAGRDDPEPERSLRPVVERARELGGELVWLRSADLASALVDFARAHRVTDLVVGRSRAHGWRRLLRRDALVDRLAAEAEGLDLHVVSLEEDPTP